MSSSDRGLPIAWTDVRRMFQDDGWLRDIVIEDTDASDWQRAYDYVQELVADGQALTETHPDKLPGEVVDVFAMRDTESARLHLLIDPIQINCHFFDESWIEFSVWPSGISSPAAAQRLFGFMEGLARAVGRPVILRPEDREHSIWLTFDPDVPGWIEGDMFKLTDLQINPDLGVWTVAPRRLDIRQR